MTTNPDITLEQNISPNETILGEEETINIQENDFGVSVPEEIIYVNQNATGNNDGTSWENAYTDLQSALNAAESSQEIWVAEGTYYPTTDSDRNISFVIKDRVKVYGGFAGNETELNQRDFVAHPVTLSGNIGDSENFEDNSRHVVDISDTSAFFTVFDGFRIVDGNSNAILGKGGGIYARDNGEANLSNLILANNSADEGGAIFVSGSTLSLNNAVFINNFSAINGGAISAFVSEGEINNALFVGNQSESGGAIDFSLSTGDGFDLNNNTFYNNQAVSGAAISIPDSFDRLVNVNNSIFRENIAEDGFQFIDPENVLRISNSLVPGSFDGSGEGNIDVDPLFVDPSNFNFSLQEGSPAIDVGNNAAIEGIGTDLVGNARITNDIVDLGTYEFVLTSEDIPETPDTSETPDPLPDGEPVYRFFIPDTGVHFYTVDGEEKDDILETQPDYVLEGTPYSSAPADDSLTGVAPIYRFLNTDTGVRIYTIAEAERDSIETLSNYEPEGIAYYGYTEQVEDTTPVFRFYNPIIDAHFYTSSAVERDSVLENLPDYQLESNGGVAFYVEPIFNSETPISSPSNPETPADSSLPSSLGDILSQLIS